MGQARSHVAHLVTGQNLNETKAALLQRLRREVTPAELRLWSFLRGNRLHGLHFRRQQLVHGFVADFYCHAAGVVIEADGGIHDSQAEYDTARNEAFAALGLLVLRFSNETILNDTANALQRIATECAERVAPQTHPRPLPAGRGEHPPNPG